MKITLPLIGETNICADDSCDGEHCKVCGCHFADWYNGGPVCERCNQLSDADKLTVARALYAEYNKIWPVDSK